MNNLTLGVDIDPHDPTQEINGVPIREMQCLLGLARGLTAQEIGNELYLGRDTVKTYMTRLYRRVAARSGPHAVARGYESGLLPLRVTDEELAG